MRTTLLALFCIALSSCAKPVAPPLPVIGGDTAVAVGAFARLDGSATTDPNLPPRPLTLTWSFRTLPAGSAASFNDAHVVTPSFRADVAGEYVVQLVADNGLLAIPALATITAGPCGGQRPRLAKVTAEPARPSVGQRVKLAVEASDPDNDEACALREPQRLRYSWSVLAAPFGSGAAIARPELAAASFTPDVAGDYLIEIAIDDGTGRRAAQQVKLSTGACGGHAPVVTEIKTSPRSAMAGSVIQLSADASDADNQDPCNAGQPLSYRWRFKMQPPGSRAVLSDVTSPTPWFSPDLIGDYLVELVTTDATGLSSAPVSVDVIASVCRPNISAILNLPVAPRGGDRVAFSLDTSNSTCPSDDETAKVVGFLWTLTSAPAGSSAAFSDVKSDRPTLSTDLPGDYTFTVAVTDLGGRTFTKSGGLTAKGNACGGGTPSIPTIQFVPSSVVVGRPVQLVAPKIVNPDTDSCGLTVQYRYAWTVTDLPLGSRASLNDAALAGPSFTPDTSGVYGFSLVVTASNGKRSTPAFVSVNAGPCGTRDPTIAALRATPSVPAIGQPTLLSATVDSPDAACAFPLTLTRSWRIVSAPAGATASLSDATADSPSLLPDTPGTYVVRLTARDGSGHAASQDLTFATSACGTAIPSVTLGSSTLAPNIGSPVSLNATVTDSDNGPSCGLGQAFTFSWSIATRPSGSQALISNPAAPSPSFTPDVVGGYQLRLVVTDSTGRASPPATLNLTTTRCGQNPPTAALTSSGGGASAGGSITLNAIVSDPDTTGSCNLAQTFTFLWSLASLPPGSQAVLSNPSSPSPTFFTDAPGTYQLRLVVTDSTGLTSAPLFLNVSTNACGTNAPAAIAVGARAPFTASQLVPGAAAPLTSTDVAPRTLDSGIPIQVSANVVDLDDTAVAQGGCGLSQALAISWGFNAIPAGSSGPSFNDPQAFNPSFTPDVAGEWILSAKSSDSTGRSSTQTFKIVTGACGVNAPVARITAAATTVAVGTTVTLDGSSSSDADTSCSPAVPQTLTYRWTFTRLPAGSSGAPLNSDSLASPSFTPDAPGSYALSLEVGDGTRRSAPATVTITAN